MSETSIGRHHRNFGSRQIYLPKRYNSNDNLNICDDGESKFRFKNSLIITPNYETEFESTGGIKYIKNHDDCVFFSGGGISAMTNGVQKLPVMLKRGVNKLSSQKKLIVEEKYNYEEKYEIHQNIILHYEENRVDFQISFVKNPNLETKDITTEFMLSFYLPEISENTFEYKKFAEKDGRTQKFHEKLTPDGDGTGIEYIYANIGKEHGMTIYPERKQRVAYKNRNMTFSVDNPPDLDKNYINVKFYLEKYKII